MTNKFLTPDIIAREALMVLRNNAVMSNLVYRDYSSEFVGAVGDTITVRKPAKFDAKEYKGSIEVQNATEDGVPITMDKHLDVSFSVTSKDLTLEIEDFSKQLLVPAMQAFADKIDKYLLDLQADVANRKIATGKVWQNEIVDTRKYLTENAVPLTDRRFVFGAEREADFLKTDLFISADKVGDTGTALREASLGRKFGLEFYTDQNVEEKSMVSNLNTKESITTKAQGNPKDTTLTIGATTLTGTLKKGTVLEIAGNNYTVASDVEAGSNQIVVPLVKPLDKVVKNSTAVKIIDTYTPSIMFHKNAFALVTRPLALPQGAAKSAIVNYDGFGLRVVQGYDLNTKTDTISIDMLCGVKTLDSNLAAVLM